MGTTGAGGCVEASEVSIGRLDLNQLETLFSQEVRASLGPHYPSSYAGPLGTWTWCNKGSRHWVTWSLFSHTLC